MIFAKKILGLVFISFFLLSGGLLGQEEDIVKIISIKPAGTVNPGETFDLVINAEIADEWHINSDKPNDELLIPTKLRVTGAKGEDFEIKSVRFPKAKNLEFDFSDKPVSVFEGTIVISAKIQASPGLKGGVHNLRVSLNYQACNNSTCQAPTSVTKNIKVNIAGTSIAAADTAARADGTVVADSSVNDESTLNNTETLAAESSDSVSNQLESQGLLLSIIIVFLGGLALNLTPCVYPLIPITVGYFGGQSEGRTSKLFMLGVLYVLGMALTYSVIGVVTAMSGAMFGALLQNPFVIIAIVLVLFTLSLSMFGVYEFKLPDSLVAKAGGARGGIFGAFFMGLTMGIVAAPCIGPFVLGLVTYVGAKADPLLGFLLFFSMAVGLGLPYMLLALFSGKIKKLPRAGYWMDAVKHIFGFLLLGMALYFLLPLIPQPVRSYALPVYMIAAALYLLLFDRKGSEIQGFNLFKMAFSVLIIAVAVYFLLPGKNNAANTWSHYNQAKFSTAASENKPVIIDFYADWCIPCKELDAVTFANPKVKEELDRFVKLKVDMTKSPTGEKKVLSDRYKVVGMPTVVILNSGGREVRRLTGFVGPEEFLSMIRQVK